MPLPDTISPSSHHGSDGSDRFQPGNLRQRTRLETAGGGSRCTPNRAIFSDASFWGRRIFDDDDDMDRRPRQPLDVVPRGFRRRASISLELGSLVDGGVTNEIKRSLMTRSKVIRSLPASRGFNVKTTEGTKSGCRIL